jgi:hypothetical protein
VVSAPPPVIAALRILSMEEKVPVRRERTVAAGQSRMKAGAALVVVWETHPQSSSEFPLPCSGLG